MIINSCWLIYKCSYHFADYQEHNFVLLSSCLVCILFSQDIFIHFVFFFILLINSILFGYFLLQKIKIATELYVFIILVKESHILFQYHHLQGIHKSLLINLLSSWNTRYFSLIKLNFPLNFSFYF